MTHSLFCRCGTMTSWLCTVKLWESSLQSAAELTVSAYKNCLGLAFLQPQVPFVFVSGVPITSLFFMTDETVTSTPDRVTDIAFMCMQDIYLFVELIDLEIKTNATKRSTGAFTKCLLSCLNESGLNTEPKNAEFCRLISAIRSSDGERCSRVLEANGCLSTSVENVETAGKDKCISYTNNKFH